MQITYLHQYFVTPEMAGGIRSYEIARRLVSMGHSVRMIAADCSPKGGSRGWRVEKVEGVEVHWLPTPYDNKMSYRERTAAFIRFARGATLRACRYPTDLVFATSTPLTIAIPGIIASFWRRAPMVFEVRDMWPDVPIAMGALGNPMLRAGAKLLEQAAYRTAAHIVALAPGMREDIIAKGISPDKVSINPNGADFDIFGSVLDAPSVRSQNVWMGDRPMILYTGTIGKATGVEYAVELAAAMLELDPEIRFPIVGDGAEGERIRLLATRLGVLDRNIFFLGRMSKRETSQWVRECDIMLALFTGPRVLWKDAVQNKFFDALAAGKPTANNFDGWQTRVAEKTDSGLLIDPANPRAAAAVLQSRLRDPVWMAASRKAALKLGRETFDRNILVARLDKILRGVKTGTVVADTAFAEL